MALYAFLKPSSLEVDFENALLSNQPDELVKFSAPLEKAFTEIKDWSINNSGRCLSCFGESICIEVSLDKAGDLAEFMKKFEYMTKLSFAVGLGVTPLEAFKAMLASESTLGQKIVMYSDEVEQSLSESSTPSDALTKSDSGFSSLDLSGLALDEKDPTQPPQQQAPAQQQQEKPSQQDKIVEALTLVKEKASVIAQLKQIDPQAYDAIKKIVDAMIIMAQGGLNKVEPVGTVKDGRVKSEARDMATREVTGTHWHKISAGAALGPTGHAVSGLQPDKE
jgi:hypothetical protein